MTAAASSDSLLSSLGLSPPVLDSRTPDDIYAACLLAARSKLPDWAVSFGDDPMYFDRSDPGLVLFKLFGELFHKLNTPLNGVPDKYAMAFWDFMGVTLRPPEAAETPIAFTTTGKTAVVVPPLAQVIASQQPGLVFQITEAVKVLPLTLAAAIGVQPDADAYIDYSDRLSGQAGTFSLFGPDPAERPFAHQLYMGDAAFDFTGLTGTLTIALEGANLYAAFFQSWSNAAGAALKPEMTVNGYDTLTFTFADLPDLPPGTVDGISEPWLAVGPAAGARIVGFQEEVLPQIYSVAATISLEEVAADAAMYNGAPVDLKKGGRPFGYTPSLQDSFYLASQTVFSRQQAEVTLDVRVQPIVPPGPVTLAWEYWDGEGWSALGVIDGTANFTQSGKVTFTCPQIEETAVNNKKNYWIRARIAAGGYGAQAGMVVTETATQVVEDVLAPYVTDPSAAIAALTAQGINFGYVYQPATWTPPFIEALAIGCLQVKRPEQMLTLNGFDYAQLNVPLDGRPFVPPPEERPTFYLGLDCDAYESQVADGPLTLFCAPADIPGALPAALADRGGLAVEAVGVDYLSPDGWQTLTPIRTASRSSRDGVAIFQAPTVFPPAPLLGQTRRWLRLQAPSVNAEDTIVLSGIYANVAPAVNAVTHAAVILGSSTGEPDQVFEFPQKSILAGPVVKVLEPVPATFSPDDADLQALLQDDLDVARQAGQGELLEAWVTWKEVSNFDFSTPLSRDYLLDHSTGEIAFGDGVRGLIPPKGKRNIQAFHYRSGGGPGGNVPAGTLDTLKKAIPGLGPLRNVMDAVGGVAADKPEELRMRAPAQVRGQGLAVTLSDFANVAVEASQDVVRAVCEDTDNGAVRLTILPRDAGQTPTPGFDLTSRVEDEVRSRALPLLGPYIVVAGPDYPAIAADITVALKPGATQPAVKKALESAYARFLNPLTGGSDGQGWLFGARVTASSVAEMAGQVAGVAFVDGVSLGEDMTAIDLAPNQLPAPGPLCVEFVHA